MLLYDLHANAGHEVTIACWVNVRRDHGKLIFLDLRDESGVVQAVVSPQHEAAHATASAIRSEWVIAFTGLVKKRPEKMVNPDVPNGDIELEITAIEVLNEAVTPAFDVTQDTSEIDEAVRLRYRYLDLRSARLQRNIRIRSEFVRRCREHLFGRGFTEIETPLLTKSTPEGSRDFLVPSRLQPGEFYALPQSPQQYKQLLMIGGFEKYFQIARCMRDEDLRADRGFEHTQIDIEMAFVDQEDVMQAVEEMTSAVVEGMGKTIKEKPFPRYTYEEAMGKFGADKFDLRSEEEKQSGVLAYAWVHRFPFFERTEAGLARSHASNGAGGWTFTHNPFSMPVPEHIDWLLQGERIGEILTTQYDLVCNGFETGGGSIRAHKSEILEAVYRVMGYDPERTQDSIGHMLAALRAGAPPHGGIALGVERNVMNLTGETQLREVQAFPQTRGGQTSVMDAPSPATPEQLRELGLEIVSKKSP
ncbi:MAG: amino acid--tRNA ligase-related protein [Patescibacteria group bacterium]|nr:amino acid--tRNA ligase-related protein [Patescibacteria group bacterium]